MGALRWRMGTFRIAVQERGTRRWRPVRGWIAGPFGIHCPGPYGGFVLTHLPTGSQVIELRRRRACKEIAEELSVLRLKLDTSDLDQVARDSPDGPKVAPLIRRYLDVQHTRQGVPSW